MIAPGPAMSYRLVGAESYESQNAVGIGVASGMIAATGLRIFFVPALYVLVRAYSRQTRPPRSRARSQSPPSSEQRPGRRLRSPPGLISSYSVIFIGSG